MGELPVVSDMVGSCVGTSSWVRSSLTVNKVGMVASPRCVVVANQFPQNGSTCGNTGEQCLLAILVVRSRPVSV